MRISFAFHVTTLTSLLLHLCASESFTSNKLSDRTLQGSDSQIIQTILSLVEQVCNALDFLDCNFLNEPELSDDETFNDDVFDPDKVSRTPSIAPSTIQEKENINDSTNELDSTTFPTLQPNIAPSDTLNPSSSLMNSTEDIVQNTLNSLFDLGTIDPLSSDMGPVSEDGSTPLVIVNVNDEDDDESFVMISATEMETSHGSALTPTTSLLFTLFLLQFVNF